MNKKKIWYDLSRWPLIRTEKKRFQDLWSQFLKKKQKQKQKTTVHAWPAMCFVFLSSICSPDNSLLFLCCFLLGILIYFSLKSLPISHSCTLCTTTRTCITVCPRLWTNLTVLRCWVSWLRWAVGHRSRWLWVLRRRPSAAQSNCFCDVDWRLQPGLWTFFEVPQQYQVQRWVFGGLPFTND